MSNISSTPPPLDPAWLDDALRRNVANVDDQSRPNLSALALRLRDIDILALNIKYFGFELARRLAAELPPRQDAAYRPVGLACKPSTQADLESDWCAHWCAQLRIPVVFHRKIWEFCFLLQALAESGQLAPGRRGLGFGCGEEPIASYLASRGVQATVTDLQSEEAAAAGWRDTGQHLSSLEQAYKDYLVPREAFDALVSHRSVDMNALPDDLAGHDFCWSICALEHLGSIEKGMDFVVNSLRTLKPGGVAIHTTEFNFLDNGRTLDNWPTVLPQRRHFEALAERLRADGHEVAPLDFDIGEKPLDRFIDVPPYPGDPSGKLETMRAQHDSTHIKLSIDGFASTCFGLIVRKARA
ncbi:methyltransferase domain-containing protein [Rhodoblastus acidophilus]|uniref:Methyltransferase domain-containing protein n=1 Tax=Candidatus Rhodoblastus alkanivorans TaxID=2954117 RepID=A0ABS9Z317_9HYPH|nr:methyltransferase domain-containing protein [Candidatus Rhodoblastus alkanivorans]MCI4677319.1 methyltransferase domain-containing protein [Candidatus Rhodoblastus alkanivorans]MCI4682054.1 methyltransferase domain-containing protein [Candidatus Rhodoblastus alkanivorans]MDI4639356.1 methyltransferase domain-containing protein [Rhodoblastus acidophilus]